MTPTLGARSSRTPPAPPRTDHWPHAVRSAETLRGTLVRCGPGVRLAGWPETPRVRATALAPWLAGGRVAIRLSAAWIWGAAARPGTPIELSTPAGRRADPMTTRDLRVRQFRFRDDELCFFGDLTVTTPIRTAADLLREPEGFDRRHRIACRLLLGLVDGGGDALRSSLVDDGKPYRRLALERLERL